MKKLILAGAAALAITACGSEPEESTDTAAAEGPVDTMLPGAFLVRTEVTSITPADDADPATSLSEGQVVENEVCIGEDGILPAAAFAEAAEECTIRNPYNRRGRMRADLTCTAAAGRVDLSVNADFTGESIEGTIDSTSSFAGTGDYQMRRTITAERTGDCTAAEAEEDLEATVEE